MFSYRSLIKQSWKIAWKNKYLWIFGLFAAIVISSGSTEYQAITNHLNQGLMNGSFSILGGLLYLSELLTNLWQGLKILFAQDIWTIINVITLIIVTITIIVSFIWLAIVSEIALIDNIKKILLSKKTLPHLNIRESMANGHKHFWSILGLNVLIKVLIYIIFVILSIPLLFVFFSNTNLLIIIYTILFVIFIPLAVSLSLMIKYAIAYKVIYNKSAVVSLEKGWKLFIDNWLISLEMAIIIFLIDFLFGVTTLLVVSLFLLPLFLIGLIFQFLWIASIAMILAFILVVIVGSLSTTFQISIWTDLFIRLNNKEGVAKIERLFQKK